MTTMRACEVLDDLHKSLRDNWGPIGQRDAVRTTLIAFRDAGLIDSDSMRLRSLALNSCPGHDDEGGRVWCAYCGDLVPQKGIDHG